MGRVFREGDRRLNSRGHAAFLVLLALLVAPTGSAISQSAGHSPLHTNEAYVEEVASGTTLDISDPMAVFAFVFNSLPERVRVYPTENYYYFRFIHDGTPHAGNIRLDASDRDEGKGHFVYHEEQSQSNRDQSYKHVVLDGSRGVTLDKVDRLVYRMVYGKKSVIFALNDLSGVKPPTDALGPGEKFVGPIFDESAIRFFLIYNSKLKIFHYILDETVKVTDRLVPAARSERILVGKRTGFAFYRDHRRDRKILVGVLASNSWMNNYFDGPFDQLPDNFIEGETLRDILVAINPQLKGKIGRLGSYPDGLSRYLIEPYLLYREEDDLQVFHRCATNRKVPPASYYNCFVVDDARRGTVRARPRRQK